MGRTIAVWASLMLLIVSCVHAGTITITCDDDYDLYLNGVYVGSQNNSDGTLGWDVPEVWTVAFPDGDNVIAVHGRDFGGAQGLIAEISADYGQSCVTDTSWKAITSEIGGWMALEFDDSGWDAVADLGPYDSGPWTYFAPPISEFSQNGARWIWPLVHDGVACFRKSFVVGDSITPPPPPPPPPAPGPGTIVMTCDNEYDLWVNGTYVGSQNNADGSWKIGRAHV